MPGHYPEQRRLDGSLGECALVLHTRCCAKKEKWGFLQNFSSKGVPFLVEQTVRACKTFLCSVLGVDKRIFSSVQTKMSNNASLGDKRSTHDNKPIKLTKELQELIRTHCKSLPHDESRCANEDWKLNYFDKSDLTLRKLHELFLEYYFESTNDSNILIEFTTYSKYHGRGTEGGAKTLKYRWGFPTLNDRD